MVGHGRHAPRVRWPGDARVAIGPVLNYEEGSEYSYPAGDGRNDGLIEVIYTIDPAYRMSIGLHPRLIGQASRIHALREFIGYALEKDKIWFARRIDIAEWWHAHHSEFTA